MDMNEWNAEPGPTYEAMKEVFDLMHKAGWVYDIRADVLWRDRVAVQMKFMDLVPVS